jgi:hypothetical protein
VSLGLDRVILPLGSRDVLLDAFEGLTPLVVEALPLLLDILNRTQAELERGGLQGAQHFSRDQIVQRRRRDMPARLLQGEMPMLPGLVRLCALEVRFAVGTHRVYRGNGRR